MKTCFKCGIEKSLSDYYPHKEMGDGHLNKCKECTKRDSKERTDYLLVNDPEFATKEKVRGRLKFHRLYKGKHKCKNKAEIMQRYENKYPEKKAAHAASDHIKAEQPGYEKHHWSYNPEHWLDTMELSVALHNKVHRYLTYDQDAKMYRTLEGTLLDTKFKHEQFIGAISLIP